MASAVDNMIMHEVGSAQSKWHRGMGARQVNTAPSRTLRIGLAQVNPTVGDLEGNAAMIIEWLERARSLGCEVVAFPELCLTGYPPEDLLLKPSFVHANLRYLERVAEAATGIVVIAGYVDLDGDIYNAAALMADGEVKGVYHKVFLPNYGVFDEQRYFARGRRCPIFEVGGVKLGITICEDIWYATGPATVQANHGAELIVNINGSPFHAGKGLARQSMLATRASDFGALLAYVNMVGGQDELVFDGNSLIFAASGGLLARGRSFAEDLVVCDLDVGSVLAVRLRDSRLRQEPVNELLADISPELTVVSQAPETIASRPDLPKDEMVPLEGVAEIYAALVLGTHDYLHKNGFSTALIGLSGGIDSSLTAAVAADALGADNVLGVLMPSRYTDRVNLEDAVETAQLLGIGTTELPIEQIHRAFESSLADALAGRPPDITEENLQPRIRGTLLMALSNKLGHLLLTTGNKSELAVGYCTLYGDMAGGFAVLKDIPKSMVYQLAAYRNRCDRAIPDRVIAKPPTAELRAGQKDTDSLPPYDVLDAILEAHVEDDRSFEEIVATGFDPEVVAWVIRMVDGAEYKRRQTAVGIKITPKAFGRDRRMPITNRYLEVPGKPTSSSTPTPR